MVTAIRRYRALGEDMYQWARGDRYGRWALRLVGFGLMVGSQGTYQIYRDHRDLWR